MFLDKPRKRKGLKDILFRRNTTSSKSQQAQLQLSQPQQILESVSGGQGYR